MKGWGSFLLELCLRQVSPVTPGLWTSVRETKVLRRITDEFRGHHKGCNWWGWSLSLTEPSWIMSSFGTLGQILVNLDMACLWQLYER